MLCISISLFLVKQEVFIMLPCSAIVTPEFIKSVYLVILEGILGYDKWLIRVILWRLMIVVSAVQSLAYVNCEDLSIQIWDPVSSFLISLHLVSDQFKKVIFKPTPIHIII